MSDQLLTTLKKLRLSGLADSLEVRLHEAAATGLGHREFLELLLQDELLVRNSRLLNRRTAAAGFRDTRRLEDFDFGFNPSIKKDRVFDLATGRFVRDAATCCSWDRRAPARATWPKPWDWRRSVARDGLLSFDLRHRARLPPRRSIGWPGADSATLPEAGPVDHRRHGHEAVAQAQRRVSVRDRAPPPRGQVDAHDQQSAPGGLGQTVGRRAQRHSDSRPVFTPRGDDSDHRQELSLGHP